MRKPNFKKLYRVYHTLEDGRRLYLSNEGKLVIMPRPEAQFWLEVAQLAHGIAIDEFVYSKDLLQYERRSYFLERLLAFVRVAETSIERADVPLGPKDFIIGGTLASSATHELRPQHDYSNTILLIS